MYYRILADFVVLLHLLWIVFLVFGSVWGAKNRTVRTLHLSGLAFAVVIQVFDWYCPLTYLEVWLREKHDPSMAYSGSYIVHYIEKLVYVEIPRGIVAVLTLLLCGFTLWFYLRRKRK